jgi:hypothetical protein
MIPESCRFKLWLHRTRLESQAYLALYLIVGLPKSKGDLMQASIWWSDWSISPPFPNFGLLGVAKIAVEKSISVR